MVHKVCTEAGTFFQGPLLIPAWIRNYDLCKVCVEITFPFPNFKGLFRPTRFNGYDYLSLLGLKLNTLSKGAPGAPFTNMD